MQEFLASLLTVLVRRALTFLGGGISIADSDVAKIVGGLLIVGDLLLQAYRHRKAQREDSMRLRNLDIDY